MYVSISVANRIRFYINHEDAQKIMASKNGLQWDFAMEGDGIAWMDPIYGRAKLQLSKFKRCGSRYAIKGNLQLSNKKTLYFTGVARGTEHGWDNKALECRAEF